MPRRAIVATAAACMLLVACGAPHGTQTLGHQRDLVEVETPAAGNHLTTSARHDLGRITRACPRLDAAIGDAVPDAWRTTRVHDLQCVWSFGVSTAAPGNDSEILVGIVDGGDYRFDETTRLLDHERRLANIGEKALYDPESRTLFAVQRGRLWYVQVVGRWPARYDVQSMTTAIARALLRDPAAR